MIFQNKQIDNNMIYIIKCFSLNKINMLIHTPRTTNNQCLKFGNLAKQVIIWDFRQTNMVITIRETIGGFISKDMMFLDITIQGSTKKVLIISDMMFLIMITKVNTKKDIGMNMMRMDINKMHSERIIKKLKKIKIIQQINLIFLHSGTFLTMCLLLSQKNEHTPLLLIVHIFEYLLLYSQKY